tara:strand:- start:4533 stop:4922 length:390 start_codon:yes stop_codon:yes gene_type:complete
MQEDIAKYHAALEGEDLRIAEQLCQIIESELKETEAKVWHAHPVWFMDGNPLAGYSKLKSCMRLLFWSGQSFEEDCLSPVGKFKAAEIRFTSAVDIDEAAVRRCLQKSMEIQWDYNNIVKRKGRLERLK